MPSDSLAVVCPHCAARMRAPAEAAGRSARCKKCGTRFVVQPAPATPLTPVSPPDGHAEAVTAVQLLLDLQGLDEAARDERQPAMAAAALAAADQALAGRPNWPACLMAKGVALGRLGQFQAAGESFALAAAANPDAAMVDDLHPRLVPLLQTYYEELTFADLPVLHQPPLRDVVVSLQAILRSVSVQPLPPGARMQALVGGATEPSPLAPCPDCGKDVSRRAPTCPHCGRPLRGAAVECRLSVRRERQAHPGIDWPLVVSVDGRETFRLGSDRSGSCVLTPGRHTIEARHAVPLVGTRGVAHFDIREGQHLRVIINPNTGFLGTRMAFTDADTAQPLTDGPARGAG